MLAAKRNNKRRYYSSPAFVWSILSLIVLCAGCGRGRGILFPELDTPLLWPELPEQPRIKYLGELSTEDSLQQAVSPLEAFKRFLFGRGNIGILVSPYALAMDKQDRLFVSDTSGTVIHMMDLQTRRYRQFSELSRVERLHLPIGLSMAQDRLYVADSILRKICVFDRDGNFQFSFGSERLKRPSGIAFNPVNKKLYVADAAQHKIFVFELEGNCISEFGAHGRGPGWFNFPTHLWVDKEGKLYVSDTLNYRIQVFSPDNQPLLSFGSQGDRPGYFAHPCGVATDSFGNIYVSDKQFENVQILNSQGQILMAFGQEGTAPGQFWLPAGIFIDNKNRIFMADSFNKRVQVFQLLVDD